ncbi:polymer-forming cytoskeletal protein [Jannaschia sp. W003]|uniref:bactofilin family protein n=1 Tax=Jannaschia sp. W003 TaxID=2867012 RepID=UPI0021A93C74|nr:polymer-forming cytoskeletal protein [Jannaschia sp. W003]UWQ20742.1 polymer-forming cytoskeletal protein [Jannaschia sp. W003]
MFSKNKMNPHGEPTPGEAPPRPAGPPSGGQTPPSRPAGMDSSPQPSSAPKQKVPASVLSQDLMIKGDIKTSGDITVEGEIEGNIHAHLLTVGEGAVVRGEIVADDIVVNGRVIGRVRGIKVRLTSTARVEGDIIHKTIAIESGAHFEGAVQRQEDPIGTGKSAAPAPKPAGQAKA